MTRNFRIVFVLVQCVILCSGRGGKLVKPNSAEASWFSCMVEILDRKGNHVCGGSLLDNKHVITSARCIKAFSQENGTNLIVQGGDIIMTNSTLPTTQWRSIDKFIVHPEYNAETLENDISLLRVSQPFMPSVNLHGIPKGITVPFGRCYLPGWSRANDTGNITRLNYLTFYVTSEKKCSLSAKHTFCAENSDNGNPCKEDYGGPLISDEKVYGIFIGPSDSCESKTALFTDLTRYEDWIESNMHGALDMIVKRGKFSSGNNLHGRIRFALTIILILKVIHYVRKL